jgi:hypothetical protein
MRQGMLDRVLGLGIVGLLGVLLVNWGAGAGEGPPASAGKLDREQQAKLNQLDGQLGKALVEGESGGARGGEMV